MLSYEYKYGISPISVARTPGVDTIGMASINTDPEDASAQAAPNGSAIPPADGEDDFEQFSSGDEQVNGAEDESVEDMSEDEPSSSESDMQSTSDEEAGKDETELQLEKLVFGDAAGFREAVQGFQGEEQGQTKDSRDESLADINDADVSLECWMYSDTSPNLTYI